MKHHLLIVVVFVALGAVLNIGVAWSCALWADVPWNNLEATRYDPSLRFNSELPRKHVALWRKRRPVGFPDEPDEVVIHPRGRGVRQTEISVYRETALVEYGERARTYELTLIDAGWPLYSFQGGVWGVARFVSGYVVLPKEGDPESLWQLDRAVLDTHRASIPLTEFRRLIPLAPTWPGFVINTVFYGGLLYLLARRLRALGSVASRRGALRLLPTVPLNS